MSDTDTTTTNTEVNKVTEGTGPKEARTDARPQDRRGRDPRQGGARERRPRRSRERRPRSEYDTKIIDIRRVTRVVAGGRRFSFSVTLVLGNGKGQVGVGIGKAGDTALAIEKATRDAKKNIVHVPLTADLSIPHEVQAKYDASEIMLIPTPGKGFKAGSAPRTVLEFAGVRHVSAKILSRSKNQLNNARSTLAALKKLRPIPHKMAKKQEGKREAKKETPKRDEKKALKKSES